MKDEAMRRFSEALRKLVVELIEDGSIFGRGSGDGIWRGEVVDPRLDERLRRSRFRSKRAKS